MYLCYVDESGDLGENPRASRHLILASAVVFEGGWLKLQRRLEALLRPYFPAGRLPELHCADIRTRRGPFKSLTKTQSMDLLAEACRIVTGLPEKDIRLFAMAIDKVSWRSKNPGAPAMKLYLDAFEHLVNRVDLFLRRRHSEGESSKGLMVVDESASTLSRALRVELGRFQRDGTQFADVYNIVETVVFLESHESPGIQFSDLCAFAVWRLVEYKDDTLAHALAVAFDREPFTASINPGKWHGIKYLGNDPRVKQRIDSVWPPSWSPPSRY